LSTKPCDQFAADAATVCEEIKAETGVEVMFNLSTMETMVEEIEQGYADGSFDSFEELLENVLWRHDFLHDVEYTAYKRWLGKVFGGRAAHRRSEDAQHGRFAAFAPLE